MDGESGILYFKYNDAWKLSNGVSKIGVNRFYTHTSTHDGIDITFKVDNDDTYVFNIFTKNTDTKHKLSIRNSKKDLWYID